MHKKQIYCVFYMTLLVGSLFLMATSSSKIWWIITCLVLVIILMPNYWYLFWALIIFLLIYNINYWFYSPMLEGLIDGEFPVVKLLSQGPIINVGNVNVLVKTSAFFNIGDLLFVKGVITKPQNHNDFDFITYLYSYNVAHIALSATIERIYTHHSLYIVFKNYLSAYPLLSWMILGLKMFNGKAIYDLINALNLAHLFVVSGFHISGFLWMFKKCLSTIHADQLWLLIPLGLIWWYVYWCNFGISVLRGAFWATLKWLNNVFLNKRIDNCSLLCLVFIIMLIIWPYQIYSFSFILSFLATFTIILMLQLQYFNAITAKLSIVKYFLLSISVYCVTLPIVIYLNQAVNLLGLLISLVLSPVVIIYQLLSCLLLPFPFLINWLHASFIMISYGFNYISLIIEVEWINAFNLSLIYIVSFNVFITIKHMKLIHK